MRLIQRCVATLWAFPIWAYPIFAQDGATLYKSTCATCHDSGAERIPSRETLNAMTPERVLAAMESGPMIAMASRLSTAERHAVAEFVTGKPLGHASTSPLPQAMCSEVPGAPNAREGVQWNTWGANLANTRAQDGRAAGFTAAEVARLRLKWAFGFLGDVSSIAQPTIAGGRVYVGSQGGKVDRQNTLLQSGVAAGRVEHPLWPISMTGSRKLVPPLRVNCWRT
jgi:polyvinyl alcohol dehydrogenase (cytochrome)